MNCKIETKCGGCQYLKLSYEEQLAIKKEELVKAFNKSIEIIKSDSITHYRHKVVASATTFDGKLRLGLFMENSRQVIPFLDCLIQDELSNQILKELELILNKYKIPAYDINKNSGIIKHILIRKSYSYNEYLIVFVTNGNLLPNQKNIVNETIKKYPVIKTITQNIHNKKTHLVLLENEKVLFGKGFICDKINDLNFKLSSRSFYQVNPEVAIKLYNKALDIADIKSKDFVVDCYSGIGTISLLASERCNKVLAIEINKSSHDDAVYNKNFNKINNVEFINGDVGKTLINVKDSIDLLIMDPTREGASKEFIDLLKKIKPKKILYISCFYETQKRDINMLKGLYEIKDIFGADMFPWTNHVESCVLLERKK